MPIAASVTCRSPAARMLDQSSDPGAANALNFVFPVAIAVVRPDRRATWNSVGTRG
jgi:hypothetical protein